MRRLDWRAGIVLLAAGLAGCMGAQAGTPEGGAQPLAGTDWRVESLNGQPPLSVPGSGVPGLSFAAGELRVSGNGGCNLFGGPYTQSGESLRMGPLASTRRACLNQEANAQETAYLQALESTTRFSVTGDQLQLFAGEQPVVRLRRVGG